MNNRLVEFRNESVPYFSEIFIDSGYETEQAEELAYHTVKIMEAALAIFQKLDAGSSETESIIEDIYLLFDNKTAFEGGRKILNFDENI